MDPRYETLLAVSEAQTRLIEALDAELLSSRKREQSALCEASLAVAEAVRKSHPATPSDMDVQKFWAEFRRTHTGEDLTGDEFAWHNLFEFQREGLRACAKFFRG